MKKSNKYMKWIRKGFWKYNPDMRTLCENPDIAAFVENQSQHRRDQLRLTYLIHRAVVRGEI